MFLTAGFLVHIGMGFVMLGVTPQFTSANPNDDQGQPSGFTEEAVPRGVNFAMAAFPQPQGYLGQGAGFADLDNDGDPDIILIGATNARVGVFENIGGGSFIDRSATTGIPDLVAQEGFAAADYDGDGLIDLYLTQHSEKNVLMRNLGGFTFSDVSFAAGVDDDGPATGASWGDYDDDGWLDLYVNNYSIFTPMKANVLYHNNGDGTFENVAFQEGVASLGLSFQSVWTDYDRDGDVDLYISNDRGPLGYTPNELYRNDNGEFVDVSESSNANVSLFSMGLAVGDFDGNGYIDFYTTNIAAEPPPLDSHPEEGVNPLLLNQGDGTFVESAIPAEVANYTTSWGAIFFDFDNNTYKDLYVNNMWKPNNFYRNDGGFPCVEIAEDIGVQASYDPDYDPASNPPANIVSFSSAVADVDDDGDMDLLVNNVGYRAELFINHEGSNRNHIRYSVVGEHPNNHAIGVNIETFAGGRVFWDENYAGGNGYLGQNESILHVGLNDIALVDQAIVNWPSAGPTRTLTNLPVNETWTIYPPSRLCDYDGDAVVDDDDYDEFETCFFAGFTPGCEMMDFTGNSSIYVDDLAACFVNTEDCNLNGTLDQAEILFDPSLDLTGDGAIDCCSLAEQPIPNPVGDTLLLDRAVSNPVLSWTAPASDAANHPASSYDVLRSNTTPDGDFLRLTNVTGTTHTDTSSADVEFYLVVARNDCGSSGEEPF